MEENSSKEDVKDDTHPVNGGTTAYSTASDDGNMDEDPKKEELSEHPPEKEERAQNGNMSEAESEGEITEKKTEAPKSKSKDESASSVEVTALKTEQSQYSTRGRNSSRETEDEVINDRLEGLKSRFDDDVGIERSHTSSAVSFLDNITEEQRRTRMRFLPAVDGMTTLSKSEIKHDLQLARRIMSSGGHSSSLSSRRARRKDDDDSEMVDEEDGTGQSEDEGMAENVISSESSGNANSRLVSKAFVAPPIEQLHRQIFADGDSRDVVGGDGTAKVFSYASSSPHIVESTTAFDPPRPPESVGPKKKHRMMRWESRPEDVEVDLDSYRKTVQRTRKELQNAQGERQRIEWVSGYLRSHFLAQLSALNDEGQMLNEELEKIQPDCVKAADLLQSRTRSRGVGKGSYVMTDVLNILKTKGVETSEKDEAAKNELIAEAEPSSSGIGGICAKGLIDWSQEKEVRPAALANGYILVGDKVDTPYGEGVVKHVYGPTILDVDVKVPESTPSKNVPSNKMVQHGFGAPDSAAKASDNGDKGETNADEQVSNSAVEKGKQNTSENESENKTQDKTRHEKDTPITNAGQLLAPRVCVELPFGKGYFRLEDVTSQEVIASYSDSMLVSRWKKMVDTSLSVAGMVDLGAMAGAPDVLMFEKKNDSTAKDDSENECMDTSENCVDAKEFNRFIPYGSAMIPTSCGRGAKLYDIPITSLEREMDRTLFANVAILGQKINKGIPKKFREWEDIRDEISVLHAEVLHRRNEIKLQSRIQVMNERCLATAREKSNRLENLVIEMRTDLKSLKDRLDYELIELGIDGEEKDRLLAEYYEEEDYEDDFASVNPPKRTSHYNQHSAKQTRNRSTSVGSQSLNNNERSSIDGKHIGGLSTDDDLEDGRQQKRARHSQ
mmetsp:Transcript_371/g.522  ORF Transcript_371/g.522 Transcript_371/m.522 type:complete len:898 (+) Transcript_371:157-2850(+)|eukprot:CAMPEP_0194211884 /NCGR_PEP_ID=MMETSP0156-20130528/11292_1 /TAXON_ID=33649 /ORGANISM="Thalassionema nitzschioides, Strain L26-B" /LENGTH=897 /DNA_ID=CAMNT_0038939571 /DNA_START=101 /DNA_END=2794 /DNA_ORIENTATION=+